MQAAACIKSLKSVYTLLDIVRVIPTAFHFRTRHTSDMMGVVASS